VEIIKRIIAEGHLVRFPWLWQFPQASPSLVSFFFASFFFLAGADLAQIAHCSGAVLTSVA
jgi:hypothetical protein